MEEGLILALQAALLACRAAEWHCLRHLARAECCKAPHVAVAVMGTHVSMKTVAPSLYVAAANPPTISAPTRKIGTAKLATLPRISQLSPCAQQAAQILRDSSREALASIPTHASTGANCCSQDAAEWGPASSRTALAEVPSQLHPGSRRFLLWAPLPPQKHTAHPHSPPLILTPNLPQKNLAGARAAAVKSCSPQELLAAACPPPLPALLVAALPSCRVAAAAACCC